MASPSIPTVALAELGPMRQRVAVVGALGAVALLWLLPFVWTEHRFPLAALDSELVAAACLGLGLMCCGLGARVDVSIGWGLPALLSLLVILGYVQLALGWLT